MGREIRAFYRPVYSYFGETHSVDDALQVMICGVRFMQTVEQWYKESRIGR